VRLLSLKHARSNEPPKLCPIWAYFCRDLSIFLLYASVLTYFIRLIPPRHVIYEGVDRRHTACDLRSWSLIRIIASSKLTCARLLTDFRYVPLCCIHSTLIGILCMHCLLNYLLKIRRMVALLYTVPLIFHTIH